MTAMATIDEEPRERTEPGERRSSPEPRESRRLAEAPSARYVTRAQASTGGSPSALTGPLARAALVAIGGAVVLTVVGAILASTFGLVFAAGASGAAIGLVLSRAAVPTGNAAAVPRSRVGWLAIGLALVAVVVAAVLTWLIARGEGGTLDPIDYLLTTFGPFVPAEAVIASIAAWWGASTGPVQA